METQRKMYLPSRSWEPESTNWQNGTAQYDLQYFKRWPVAQLKEYISNRGYATSGNKETLVALAYGLHVSNAPLIASPEQVKAAKAADYGALLLLNDVLLPDPLTELKDEWLDEHHGMQHWPPKYMYWDICQFLGFGSTSEYSSRLMSDYKEGKAYSYFTSGTFSSTTSQ